MLIGGGSLRGVVGVGWCAGLWLLALADSWRAALGSARQFFKLFHALVQVFIAFIAIKLIAIDWFGQSRCISIQQDVRGRSCLSQGSGTACRTCYDRRQMPCGRFRLSFERCASSGKALDLLRQSGARLC